MAVLDAFLQRLPGLSHLFVLGLAVYGPTFAPVLLASLLFFCHAILFANNGLTVWGQFCAARGMAKACEPRAFDETDVEHVIIVPAYKEDLDTLRHTLDVLASHQQTRSSYHVCLAMEERESGSEKKALQLEIEFEDVFADLTHSMHPVIAGEAAGKSSNVNWAARYMSRRLDVALQAVSVITVIDADTCLAQDYFQLVSESFQKATPDQRARKMFAVPIIFDRNAHQVPVLVRLTDIMWAQAGLSCTYPSSDIKIPTSVYGISMELAMRVGFWDTGYAAIGEDMHHFVKAFLTTGGNLDVETIYSPASQLNVVGADHCHGGMKGWISDLRARYAQGMRHMWGSLDTGYALARVIRGDVGSSKDHVRPLKVLNLLFRLFQAHQMLGWVLILLIRDQMYPLVDSPVGPRSLMWIVFCINATNFFRGFSVVSSILTMICYERYHWLASVKRWRNTGLGMRAEEFAPRRLPWCLLEMVCIPGCLLFGIVPLYHAQFMHLFTQKLTYTVSIKLQRTSRVPFASEAAGAVSSSSRSSSPLSDRSYELEKFE